MHFKQAQLDNGLEIIAECNPDAYSVGLGVFVNAGSRDETPEISGVSHFLEHMVFKGTERRSAADVNRELDEMGSHSNARTSEEKTVYHAAVLPEFQTPCVELLCDIMRPALRENDFETEKQVIIEEILMYDDQPPYGGQEKIMANFFGEHPLSKSVLGTTETVGNLSSDQMRTYFQSRYSPSNIVISAAGNVDFDELVRTIDRCTKHWEQHPVAPRGEKGKTNAGKSTLIKPQSNQAYVLQLSDAPDVFDDRRYASRLLATILGDDSGSRLFWEFVDPGIAEFASMSTYEFEGHGVYWTSLCCEPDEVDDCLGRLDRIYAEIATNEITEDELERAKQKYVSFLVLQSERPENRMFSIGNTWSTHRKYRTVRESADSYRSVTKADLEAVMNSFDVRKTYTLVVGPG